MADQSLQGTPVSGGVVLGRALLYWPGEVQIPLHRIDEDKTDEELAYLDDAVARAAAIIKFRREEVVAELGEAQAAIFDAHLCLLTDPVFLDEIRETIVQEKVNSAFALHRVSSKYKEIFMAMEDPYLKERASDVEDVTRALLREIVGDENDDQVYGNEPGVLIARDLMASDIARVDRKRILGFATIGGGPNTHASILAKGWQLPAVVGCGESLKEIPYGARILLDGNLGAVHINPSEETVKLYEPLLIGTENLEDLARAVALDSVTKDGQRVFLQANIDMPEDLLAVRKFGARGIGLYRTEFLFMNRRAWPAEEEQAEIYRQIIEGAGSEGITIRTIDTGGDKAIPYLREPSETNPFLGLRGIRWALKYPDLFKSQIRALLRAAARTRLRVMVPMVCQVNEITETRRLFMECIQELEQAGIPHTNEVSLGVMVEIPAAVHIGRVLFEEADFVSIGTNDLTQYTLAVDRQNQQVAYLYQGYHPAVLKLIEQTAAVARGLGKEVSLCGEMAGDPLAVPLFLGMGIHSLSMVPPKILEVKMAVRSWTAERAREITKTALSLGGPDEVKELLTREYTI